MFLKTFHLDDLDLVYSNDNDICMHDLHVESEIGRKPTDPNLSNDMFWRRVYFLYQTFWEIKKKHIIFMIYDSHVAIVYNKNDPKKSFRNPFMTLKEVWFGI